MRFRLCRFQYSLNFMSFGIEPKKLKSLIDLYYPHNHGEELRYMIHLKGEEQLFRNLETCPFQGISVNSIEDRESVFGKNTLPPRKISIFGLLFKAFSPAYIWIPIVLSISLIFYNGKQEGGNILEGLIMICTTVLNWLLKAVQQIYLSFKWSKTDANLNQVSCTIVRQNKREKVLSSQLTVGDIVQFKQGDTIPADGWLIQGFDIFIVERHLSQFLAVQKETLRKCITDIKAALEKNPNFNQKNIPLDQIKSPKSPVLLSGSTVKSGEGRMVVLCVGKYSRQGQLLSLSRQKLEPNLLKLKIQTFRVNLYRILMLFAAFYVVVYIGQNLQKGLTIGFLKQILNKKQWTHLHNCLIGQLFGAPLGLHLGLMICLAKIKLRMWLTDGIWVEFSQDLPKMAAVTQICYDRQKDWGKIQNKEWWNEQKITFHKEQYEEDEKQASITEQNYIEQIEMSQDFKKIMKKGLKLKGSEQPGHHYFVSQGKSVRKKNVINDWNVFQESMQQTDFHYLCVGNTVKYLTLGDSESKIVLVKGQSRDILQISSTMLMKSSGQTKALSADQKTLIYEVIQSMERRLVTTHALAFASHPNPALQGQITIAINGKLTFLCILGVTNSHDHSDYEIVRQLRQAGISLVLVSSRPQAEAVSRSKFIGINTIQHDSLVLDSHDFAKVVGGVICFTCKKTFCVCADESDNNPRLKNLEQFRRITRYLKVVSSANFFQKYSIMIGYRNVGRLTAYMGTQQEDRPAQAAAYLSVASQGGLKNSQLTFPSNSLRILQSCIIWSRMAALFTRKLIQLMLPASLVPVGLIIITGLLFRTAPFSPLQLFWVSVPLCIVSAINLSWQHPQQQLRQQASSFGPQSPLLPQSVRKQIIGQCIMQTLLLMILLAAGHEFLPENSDQFDDIIDTSWQAKYSNSNKDRVASGLYQNFMFPVPSYQTTFQTYGIYSRHLTIVFNTFALMQILNYFNCRKVGSKQINVLQGLEWHNAFVFIITLAAHCIFVQISPQSVQLYAYGLTVQQWLFSAGMAIIVWVVGFIVRLLPDSSEQHLNKRRWRNKSYNLNVKLVGKSDKFFEFDRDQDAIFKLQ